MATYLVTGGAGFIGSHMVEELVRRGETVRVLDNLATGKTVNLARIAGRIDFQEADIRDLAAISPHFTGAQYVIHLAALPSVARSVDDPLTANEVNVTGTLNVLLAARDAGVKRLVFAASAAAYGDNPTMPRVETLTPDPLSPYALAKVAGEYYCRVFTTIYGLETVALRFFNIFGPRQNPDSPYTGVLSKFVPAYELGNTPVIFGDGEQSRDFTYVDNVVDATHGSGGLWQGHQRRRGPQLHTQSDDRHPQSHLWTKRRTTLRAPAPWRCPPFFGRYFAGPPVARIRTPG